jgi:hypothetical protein
MNIERNSVAVAKIRRLQHTASLGYVCGTDPVAAVRDIDHVCGDRNV